MRLEKYDSKRYNEKSNKFVNEWLGTDKNFAPSEIIGTWRHKSNSRPEDYLFYRSLNDNEIRVAVVCHKEDDGKPCFFGDLNHFITVIWVGATKLNKFWKSCFWYDRRNTRRIRQVLEHTFGVKIK